MLTSAILVSLLAAFSTAVPTTKRATSLTFAAITVHSGNSDVHLRSLSASHGFIYIGQPSSAYCPSDINCAAYSNDTILSYSPTHTTLSLDVAVAGGQQVYVSATGALGFTQAHASSVPNDSYIGPWQYNPQSEPGSVGTLTFEGEPFWACPVSLEGEDEDVYQIYAEVVTPRGADRSACISVGIATSEYSGKSAYEFEA